jgi:hypothetical protein
MRYITPVVVAAILLFVTLTPELRMVSMQFYCISLRDDCLSMQHKDLRLLQREMNEILIEYLLHLNHALPSIHIHLISPMFNI